MNKNTKKMEEKIINLTLEILYQLTGEDYTMVKKTSSDGCRTPVSEGRGRTLNPISRPPPPFLIHEGINVQKILDLTYKMMELLTGEVPIRCQDVTVYFSMDEWEYLEGHKDLYKDVMMEDHQPLTSPIISSKRTTPERCPRPLLPQDHQLLNQDKDLCNINAEETSESWDEPCTEDDPSDNRRDDCTGCSEEHLLSADFKAVDRGITPDTYEEHAIIPDTPSALHSKELSSDPITWVVSSDSSLTVQQNSTSRSVTHQRSHKGEKPNLCLECGKCSTHKICLVKHQRTHRGKNLYSCSECAKCFTAKSDLVRHQRSHTGEKPYLCPECGKCFTRKSYLISHQRVHTGEKPFSCVECGKFFSLKSHLISHHIVHTGEKSFSCPECGKCFTLRSSLVRHQSIHTGEKPYSCPECEKCFTLRSSLVKHQSIHTGEKPFSCSECGKCFSIRSNLVKHQSIHTGEKPFSCPECKKCFSRKSYLFKHKRIHKGEKRFSCPE